MKNILIIAAPFGFGPSSIALTIAEYLRSQYQVFISGTGNAIEFLQASAPADVKIISGQFGKSFETEESLAGFHAFIAVNQVHALLHLVKFGFASRLIFVDSIAQWRTESAPFNPPENLLAYVVQDELRETSSDRIHHPAGAVVVAPFIWPEENRQGFNERRGVLVHTGGISPTTGAGLVSANAASLIEPIVQSIAEQGQKVTMMGSADIFQGLTQGHEIDVLGSISPASAKRAIGEAKLLITTPGIGAVNEAMSMRTPVVLLPPMNSTQLQHYRVLTKHGIIGVLGDAAFNSLQEKVTSLPWPHQTPAILHILAHNARSIARKADSVLKPFVAIGNNAYLEDYSIKIGSLGASFAKVSPKEIMLDRLARLS